jgi:FGGY-family pentulose kinase
MTDSPYLMGIDLGTEGVRAGIFDREGAPVGFSSFAYETHHPHAGWAEQDPDQWWSALTQAVPAALDDGGVSAEEIAGISVDATSSTVLAVDADGRPLRPAILWMDVRASAQAEWVAAADHAALKYSGHADVSAEFGLPKALWLRDQQPDTYDAAEYILDAADWVTQRLTGERTLSINTASCKYYFDREAGGWPTELYEQVGAADLLDKFAGDVLDVGQPVGGLRRSVAEELGLRPDTPVAEASVDAYAGALGLGVVEPGTLALITGSSHVIIGHSAEPVHDPGLWGAYTDALIPGLYTIEAGQASTGSVVAWFKNQFAGEVLADAERRGVDAYDILGELAREVPVGSNGLLVLDYFQGSRSPHADPHARGAISGLSLSHGLGHVFRALMEGVCYGTEDILHTLRNHEFVPKMTVVSGGPAKSELWMQIHADVSNVPITFTEVSEGPVLGSAIQASVGAGIHPDLSTVAKSMVRLGRTIEPDAARHEEYRFWVERYRELYGAIRDEQHRVVEHLGRDAAGTGGGESGGDG